VIFLQSLSKEATDDCVCSHKPKTPVRIAQKDSAFLSQKTRTDESGAATPDNEDSAPTLGKPPEPGVPLLLASPPAVNSNGMVVANKNQGQVSEVGYYYPPSAGQVVSQTVDLLGMSPQTHLETFQPASSEGWKTNMRILVNSIGTTFMTVPVRFDPTCEKSSIRQPFVELSGYQVYDYGPWLPNKAMTPWGSKERILVTDIIVELEHMKAYQFVELEVVTADPGAVLVIGREDMVQIEAHLGHSLRRIDSLELPATLHAQAASYGIPNDQYGGYNMASTRQGTSLARCDTWS
jgi:hypothetical protein